MDYIGVDPSVGLECSHCNGVTQVKYSVLLSQVVDHKQLQCNSCKRFMLHDWSTVQYVQNIIKQRMREVYETKKRQRQ